jgi:hypothetical protein
MYIEREIMTNSFGMRSAVCAAALLAGTAAHAELTAAQVWDDWKSQLGRYGDENLTIGAEETSSGTLTVRDITVSLVEDDVVVDMTIEDITFNEQSDGSVRVTMDDSYPLIITSVDGVVVTIMMTQSNLEMIVSGDPESMDYAITADSYEIAFQDAVDGDVTINGDARMIARDLAGSYNISKDSMRNISSDASIGSVDLLVDFQIPGGEGEYVTAAAKINGIQTQSEAAVPLEMDLENPDDMFVNGFSVAGGYVIDSADYVFDINAEGDQNAGSVSTGTVTLTGELNSKIVAYESRTTDIAVNLQTSELPLPIEISLAEYGFGFRMPVGTSEVPADFGLKFDLVDLVIGDAIWDIFDPSKVLSRDPATLEVALTGKARALIDFLDPAQQAAMDSTEVPFELSSLSLDTLKIMAAGALFTGSGAFTFDNTDTQTFAPLPRPFGDATFEITGLNKLLDNIVAMGLVPEQDIMGPRMMMGMFTRSTGDDQMAIDVEIDPSGQVKVNGNRVR